MNCSVREITSEAAARVYTRGQVHEIIESRFRKTRSGCRGKEEDVMKRLLTFALLGPALGGLVIGCVIRESWTHVWYLDLIGLLIGGVVMFPFMLVLGVVPSLCVAGIDHVLRNTNVVTRMVICGAVAYVGTALWFAYGESRDGVFFAGLAGLIPAVICSWLSATPTPGGTA
jgi:hypothetical protein